MENRAMKPSVPYDALGSVYDQVQHIEVVDGFFASIGPQLDELEKSLVLDLGCGTGLLSKRLAERGCNVVGIDQSRRMLQVARNRCRHFGKQVRFVKARLESVTLKHLAAAAFASGDVINHLDSEASLFRCFAKAFGNLRKGGVITFDALNKWAFETYWANRTYHYEGASGDIVMECDWDPVRAYGTAMIVSYEKNGVGHFIRRKSMLRERFFDNGTIRRNLKRACFTRISARSWSPWLDQHEEESNDRTLWTAFK
jgi:SAM-dependent methyltransferase